MIHFERLKNILGLRNQTNRILKEKFAAITSLVFDSISDEKTRRYRLAFQSLVYPLMVSNGRLVDSSKEVYRKLLGDFFDLQVADSHIAELPDIELMPVNEAAAILHQASPEKSVRIAEFLITLAAHLDSYHNNAAHIRNASLALGMTEQQFTNFFRQVNDEEKRKQRLRNSGRGIIASLVVIVIFVLTAKYLQSLLLVVLGS